MAADTKKTVLIIEDSTFAFDGIKQSLQPQWNVLRAQDEADTFRKLEQIGEEEGSPITVVALDLGLPPHPQDAMKVGLSLARKLRNKYQVLPIMAYTSISPTAEGQDFGLLLAKLLPLQISLVHTRHLPDGITIGTLLNLVHQGFLILSPGVANQLEYAVPTKPDPLSMEQWETLKLLSENLSQQQIANSIPGIHVSGVRARLDTIKKRLEDSGEFSYNPSIDELRIWYRANYARYCHDSASR